MVDDTNTNRRKNSRDIEVGDARISGVKSVIRKIADKISRAENILVAIPKNPTVDEMAAAIGLTLELDKLNKHVTAIYSGKTPNALKFLHPEMTFEENTDSLQDFIIALNKEKADHLRYKVEGEFAKVYITPYRTKLTEDDLRFSYGDYNVDLVVALNVAKREELDAALSEFGQISHDAATVNISNRKEGELGGETWRDEAAASVSEMVMELLEELASDEKEGGNGLGQEVATALLTGIVAATERFSNEKTTSAVMERAAKLMGMGADQGMIAKEVGKTGFEEKLAENIVGNSPEDELVGLAMEGAGDEAKEDETEGAETAEEEKNGDVESVVENEGGGVESVVKNTQTGVEQGLNITGAVELKEVEKTLSSESGGQEASFEVAPASDAVGVKMGGGIAEEKKNLGDIYPQVDQAGPAFAANEVTPEATVGVTPVRRGVIEPVVVEEKPTDFGSMMDAELGGAQAETANQQVPQTAQPNMIGQAGVAQANLTSQSAQPMPEIPQVAQTSEIQPAQVSAGASAQISVGAQTGASAETELTPESQMAQLQAQLMRQQGQMSGAQMMQGATGMAGLPMPPDLPEGMNLPTGIVPDVASVPEGGAAPAVNYGGVPADPNGVMAGFNGTPLNLNGGAGQTGVDVSEVVGVPTEVKMSNFAPQAVTPAASLDPELAASPVVVQPGSEDKGLVGSQNGASGGNLAEPQLPPVIAQPMSEIAQPSEVQPEQPQLLAVQPIAQTPEIQSARPSVVQPIAQPATQPQPTPETADPSAFRIPGS